MLRCGVDVLSSGLTTSSALTSAWVDPTTGVDGNATRCGVESTPFKTIEGAFQACQTVPGGITINLAPGSYPPAGNQQLVFSGGIVTIQANHQLIFRQ